MSRNRASINRFAHVMEVGLIPRVDHTTRSRITDLANRLAELRDAITIHAAGAQEIPTLHAAAMVRDLSSQIATHIVNNGCDPHQATAAILNSLSLSLRALLGESSEMLNNEGFLGFSLRQMDEALKGCPTEEDYTKSPSEVKQAEANRQFLEAFEKKLREVTGRRIHPNPNIIPNAQEKAPTPPPAPRPEESRGIGEVCVYNPATGQKVPISREVQAKLEHVTNHILREAGVLTN